MFSFEDSFTDSPCDKRAFDASCRILDSDRDLVGTGVLIEPGVVLTAAHVAVVVAVESGYVQFEESGPYIPTEEAWIHPVWLFQDEYQDDIALIKLSCDVDDRAPIALADKGLYLQRYGPNTFIVGCSLGYKKQSLPNKMFYYGTLVSSPAELKFRSTKSSIWFGDSGGPAILMQPDGTPVVVGVMIRFALFQHKMMDYTAADVRYHRAELEQILSSW